MFVSNNCKNVSKKRKNEETSWTENFNKDFKFLPLLILWITVHSPVHSFQRVYSLHQQCQEISSMLEVDTSFRKDYQEWSADDFFQVSINSSSESSMSQLKSLNLPLSMKA